MPSAVPNTSLSNATSGSGTAIDFLTAKSNVSTVLVRNGVITGGLVSVEVSHDGTTWVLVHTFDPVIQANQTWAPRNAAFRFWRVSVISPITGGGTVSATLMEAN